MRGILPRNMLEATQQPLGSRDPFLPRSVKPADSVRSEIVPADDLRRLHQGPTVPDPSSRRKTRSCLTTRRRRMHPQLQKRTDLWNLYGRSFARLCARSGSNETNGK